MLDSPFGFSRSQAVKLTLVVLGFQVASGLAVGLVIGFVTGFFRSAHLPVPTWADSTGPVCVALINMVTFFAGCHYALKKIGARWHELLVVRGTPIAAFLAMIVTLCGAAIVLSELVNLTHRFVPPPALVQRFFGRLSDVGAHPFAVPFVLVVIAPITEELFFRGLLLRRLLATQRT